MQLPVQVLFVCVGNICRSPMAEALFRRLAADAGLTAQFTCDSAGIINYHAGERADPRTRKVAADNGLEVTHLARQIRPRDLFDFDYILNMEGPVHEHVLQMHRSRTQAKSQVLLMRSFDPDAPHEIDVPDPYNYDEAAFVAMYHLLDRSCRALLAHLRQTHVR